VTTLALALSFLLVAPAKSETPAAALVVAASGPVAVTEAGSAPRSIGALEWLPSGVVLDVASQTAVIALAGGRRYELAARARVRVLPDRLEVLAGEAHELPSVAPFPKTARLAAHEQAGARSGAMRIRGRSIQGLYPCADAVTLAEATTLRFSAEPGVAEYHVEIEDEEGATLFHVSTRGSEVVVARDVLRPGRRYRWSVRGGSAEGLARGEAEFSTLDADAAAARQKLRESLGGSDDVPSISLLAEVDRQLGLLLEARDGFARALGRSPGSSELHAAQARVEAQLRGGVPPE